MVTKRDAQVLQFITDLKVAKTSTLQEIFFPSYLMTARRLNILTRIGEIQRERDGWSSEYVYYINKQRPKQFRHALLLSDFYRELHKIAEIKKFKAEPNLGDIRPDAIIGFNLNGTNRLALVEIEISNKGFNYAKYDKFDWKEFFPVEPEIIIVSDKKLSDTKFKTTVIKTDMDLSKLL